MKIYLAGTSVCKPNKSRRLRELFKNGHKLHSYYHALERKGLEGRWFRVNTKNNVSIMLDSGAYSAWTQGVEIKIEDYIEFIKKHSDTITHCINLDVILDGEGSYNNWVKMREAGIDAIPVYHLGTDEKWLEKYLAQTDYIALGAIANMSTPLRLLGLSHIWEKYLLDDDGYPKFKVHGLGLTSFKIMKMFPWYSVDSTSWVATGRNGSIYVPRQQFGEWIYDEDSWKITVSSRSPKTKDAGQHIDTLSPKQRALIIDYIHAKGYKLGKSRFEKKPQSYELKEGEKWAEKKPRNKDTKRMIEIIEEPGICNNYRLRDELNIIYFQDLEKSFPEWPWKYKRKGFKGFSL